MLTSFGVPAPKLIFINIKFINIIEKIIINFIKKYFLFFFHIFSSSKKYGYILIFSVFNIFLPSDKKHNELKVSKLRVKKFVS